MKKYVKPSMQMISRNELDIICTSDLFFPIIPLSDKINYSEHEEV